MKYSVSVPLVNSLLILISITASVCGQQKFYSIHDFPPLYKFDDYDSCLEQKYHNTPPTYCMVYAEIKPNNSSDMWQEMMQHYGEYPFRYRRDHLFFGVCMERCLKFAKTKEIYKLNEDDLIKNEITDYFGHVHKRPLDEQFRKEYHDLIHNCLNHEFQQKYDLNLRTYIEYCEGPKDVNQEETKDPLESLLYKILGVIIILNILSTLYDFCLKLQQPEENQTNDFYKINPQQKVSRLLTSFSVCRNYYRLVQPYFSDVGKDFQFLDGYRSICMMFALFGHTFFCEYQHIANPQYFEKSSKDENNLWVLNTTMIIETYFVMSGLLLFIKFQQGRYVSPQTSWKKFFFIYVQFMVFRFIRFLPSVGLLVLVNATILTRLQNGPFWRHITEPVRVFSRERGWRNLLMINNFSHKESASHHTWYIAADWQLFALYLFIIMIVAKYPKIKKHIFSTLAILSFVIPFSISYLLKLKPCFIIKPESYRYSFFKDIDVYFNIYTPFYTNLFGYLFGIICAEIYLKYTRTEEIRKTIREKPIYTVATHFVAIVAFLLFWLGPILEVRATPSIWSALYAGLHRILWIMFVCGLPLVMMSCNCGWIAYEFCCLPIFRILARLSFQVYIWHMTIVYLINGYQRQPYYVDNLYFFTQFVILYCFSNAVAFIIALFVEYPIAQSVQVLQSKSSDKSVKKS
ncbi:regulator of hypoxia-inducible factor 1-like [Lucilia sericata]|uniref:regulator of hypoxia-inducible factor 1-like n=1 Tax=Lucilia sericata TaxID=13632 RepID=UPI0018A844B7|nr:regulator of hypoxia-inducible factor 1-like [Lucilia sericata]